MIEEVSTRILAKDWDKVCCRLKITLISAKKTLMKCKILSYLQVAQMCPKTELKNVYSYANIASVQYDKLTTSEIQFKNFQTSQQWENMTYSITEHQNLLFLLPQTLALLTVFFILSPCLALGNYFSTLLLSEIALDCTYAWDYAVFAFLLLVYFT